MNKWPVILLILFAKPDLHGQNLVAKFDSLMDYVHEKYSFDGVVLVADHNSIIYKKAFGLANRDWNIANTIDTKFRLGSVSKQFTGFVILKLAGEGRLKFDDPIYKFLPEFNSEEKKNIKIQNLLTHTSGIFDYTDLLDFNSKVLYSEDSLVKMIAAHKLNFPPSAKYAYSNSNFYLLNVISEKVSGKKCEDILEEKIFIPAGMKNSGLEHNRNILSNRASPYVHTSRGFINGEYIEMDNVAAGMFSTANDMLQWSLFMQKQLENDKFIKSSIKSSYLTDGGSCIYSCGWCLLPDRMMHQGHINGFANHISLDTVNHYTIIILSNNDFKELFVTGKIFISLLHGNNDALNTLMQKMPSQRLLDYTGTYLRGEDTVYNKVENGELISYYKGQPMKWNPFCKDEFFSEVFEGNIIFERNQKNEVVGVKSFEDYNWIFYRKVK